MLRAAFSDCNVRFHGVAMLAVRLCAYNSALVPFLHHDTTREYEFVAHVWLLWQICDPVDVGVPSQWLWTSGRL